MTIPTCQVCNAAPSVFKGVAFRRRGSKTYPFGIVFVCETCPKPGKIEGKNRRYTRMDWSYYQTFTPAKTESKPDAKPDNKP